MCYPAPPRKCLKHFKHSKYQTFYEIYGKIITKVKNWNVILEEITYFAFN